MNSSSASNTGQRIDRVASADVRDGLERLQNSEVLRAGAVNLIGLEAVRANLGERWPAKRARIWEHIERDLERRLSATDMFFRLDEVTYLIAMPTHSRFMAQAACLSVLQDVLKFFLGESNLRHVVVRPVLAVAGGEIVSEDLDPSTIAVNLTRQPEPEALESHAAPAEEWKPPLVGRTRSSFLETEARRKAEVKMGVEGVWNLRLGAITSFVLERAVNPELTHPADLVKADCAVMAYAAELLKEHRERGGRLTLHIPISYSSAATRQTREKVLAVAAPFREIMRSTVLFEICELDPGVPPSRLIEVVGLLKHSALGVLARVKPTKAGLAAAKSCGLQGLVLDAHNLGATPQETVAWMKAFVQAAQGGPPNLLVHNLAAPHMIDAAASAGMTHASTRPAVQFETQIDAA